MNRGKTRSCSAANLNVYGQWPPGSHLFGEDLSRDVVGRLNADDPSDTIGIKAAGHDLLPIMTSLLC